MYFGSNDLGCEELILVTEKFQNNMTIFFLIYNVEHALTQIKTFEHQSCEYSVWLHSEQLQLYSVDGQRMGGAVACTSH
jgi:hypothetical protein